MAVEAPRQLRVVAERLRVGNLDKADAALTKGRVGPPKACIDSEIGKPRIDSDVSAAVISIPSDREISSAASVQACSMDGVVVIG